MIETDDDSTLPVPEILLERAAAALIDAASAADADPEVVDRAVGTLAEKFRGEVTFAKPRVVGAPDPERYLLSMAREGRPLEIDTLPTTVREAGDVSMTGLQVVLVADLLRELAARLRPGAAFGSSTGGLALAARTDQLADTLTKLTPVRRPPPRAFDPAERAEWLTRAMYVPRPDLRNAVVALLDVLGAARPADPPRPSDILGSTAGTAAMATLIRAVHGPPVSVAVGADDPGLFLRSVAGRPIFDEANAMRELLAAEATSSTAPPLVTIDATTAMTSGLLLKELVSRLQPGISYGLLAIRSDLGVVADDLAAELLAQTSFGRPAFYPGPTRMWITASDRLRADGTTPNVIDPVDHLAPAAELLLPTVAPSNGETFDEYKRLRAAVLELSRLLDDETADDDHFAQAAHDLHAALGGLADDQPDDVEQSAANVVHQQWRSVELSHAEVVIAADLLDELAARVTPGAAFGPRGNPAAPGDMYTGMAVALRDLSGMRRPPVIAAAATATRTVLGRLRTAAIHWLDVVADGRGGWRMPEHPAWRGATINLYLLARDRPARTAAPLVRDPARHLRRHSGDADEAAIDLAAEAADIAALLRGSNAGSDLIVVPHNLAPYVGTALGELATRLNRGAAFDPTDRVEPLAAIASSLGRRILAHAVVSYCRSWGWEDESPGPRGRLTESEARARDDAGLPYSVILGEPHRPDTIIDVRWDLGELEVTKVDEQGRPRLWFEFHRESPETLFLARVTQYRFDGDDIDPSGDVSADQVSIRPDGTVTRVTGHTGKSVWEETVAENARSERLRQPVPQFGDWEPLRDLNPLTRPRRIRPQVHYSLAWSSARAMPRAVISADEARQRDANGERYCVILGQQDDPRVLITVCRNENTFAVHLLDESKRVRTIHTFRWVDDRFLHQAQQRLIYADTPSRDPLAYSLLATFEVSLDGLARATVGEPHGRGLISEQVESVDLAPFWRPLPEFGAWEWTTELNPSPEHWPEQELVP
ncbi:hypothetical protein [Nocardia caishijiensis]|uniref:Uncharacterized protein n=1 Tax=Nocardia caishijiensis TaxID=184756 RepID=A0ABQ6YRL1_9NOCA|nr:hypothetical protein [Nocardia caishijiensis]KAF0848298.1 hypothetical protein FNL39_102446 [Nocardia caishijiensis]